MKGVCDPGRKFRPGFYSPYLEYCPLHSAADGNTHRVLWDWQQNGLKPRTSRLRGTAGKQIRRDTGEFLKSLIE